MCRLLWGSCGRRCCEWGPPRDGSPSPNARRTPSGRWGRRPPGGRPPRGGAQAQSGTAGRAPSGRPAWAPREPRASVRSTLRPSSRTPSAPSPAPSPDASAPSSSSSPHGCRRWGKPPSFPCSRNVTKEKKEEKEEVDGRAPVSVVSAVALGLVDGVALLVVGDHRGLVAHLQAASPLHGAKCSPTPARLARPCPFRCDRRI